MGFWTDLSKLSKEQFTAEVDAILKGDQASKPTRSKKPPKKVPKDNRPVTQIAFVIQEQRQIDDVLAQQLLTKALLGRGYTVGDIPLMGNDLVRWLEMLIEKVSAADVIDAARKL